MAKTGRPLVKIDEETFVKLCEIQCTKLEISGFFDCSESTIDRYCHKTFKMSFDAIYSQKCQKGRISLRRVQFQEAIKGNITMLIWLGKQYLGQSDVEKSERKELNEKINDIHEKINILQLVKE
jgi:hypothetical protein